MVSGSWSATIPRGWSYRRGTRRRVFGYFAQAGGVREEEIAEHVSPVQRVGGRGHHCRANGSWTDVALHDGRNSCGGGDGAEFAARLVCGGRGGGGFAWRESAGRELAFGFAGLWATSWAGCGSTCQGSC